MDIRNSAITLPTPKHRAAYYDLLMQAVAANDGQPHVAPYQAIVSVNMKCNSRCTYCNIWQLKDDGPAAEEFDPIMEEMVAFGIHEFVISGGEPLQKRDVIPIIQSASSRGMFVVLITNGLLLREPVLDQLMAVNTHRITLSLDSLVEEHYRAHRGVHLNRPREALELLAKAMQKASPPWFSVGINVVLSALNVHDVPDIVQYAADHRMSVQIQALNPYVDSGLEHLLPNEQTMPDFRRGLDRVIEMKLAGYPINSSLEYMEFIPEYLLRRRLPTTYQCLFGDVAVILDEHLNVLPCWFLPAVGNLRATSLHEVWFSRNFTEQRKNMHQGKCPTCWLTCNADWQISFVGEGPNV